MSSGDSEASQDHTPSPSTAERRTSPAPALPLHLKQDVLQSEQPRVSPINLKDIMTAKAEADGPINMADRNGAASASVEDLPINMTGSVVKEESKGHPERKRRASDASLDSSTTKASESILGDDITKDDEDDEDNDEEDKLAAGKDYDPERLKAFNMFVRLFVDENLDRMVPISKQPKDKIQAILDACDRQFPEFHERSRKRIRTYLKSCRRMRRSKENGWESMRPTPPHLTSAAAEGLLAQACENESNNAKRMRMGLEPLPAVNTTASGASSQSQQTSPHLQSAQASPHSQQHSPQRSPAQPSSASPAPASTSSTPAPVSTPSSTPSLTASLERPPVLSVSTADYLRHAAPAPAAFRPPHELPSPFFGNSNGIFRPGFPTYQPPAHHHPPVIQHTQMTSQLQNGTCPTDLSMKSKSSSSKNQLNPTEVATIKQLIAGYRESAAFLYRSADELEQLLLQQN